MGDDKSLPPLGRKSLPVASEPVPQSAVTAVSTGTQIIGTYEIEMLINTGGMGEVYRGRNIHNGEPVAIKIVLPSLAHDQKIVALFQKEATVLGRLNHDAIVRYHVFTNDPDIGRPCMVMEFVSGTSLGEQVEKGPMPIDDVHVLLKRVASGLARAHRAGVVHRDLSPDNIILEHDMVSQAKIIDFGIAKAAEIGGGTLLQGQFAGKFNFVSPEQLGAFGAKVDGRSDIYSLGLLVAAVCKGAILEMGASIVDAVASRQSVPDLTGVPAEMLPLLTHMLTPDPEKRPASMNDVMAMLEDPSLIPAPIAANTEPDPNRTVIGEALPLVSLPSVPPSPAAAMGHSGSNPPVTAPPAAQFSPAQGFGVGTPQEAEVDDVSPFGAPPSSAEPFTTDTPKPAEPKKKAGKGGLVFLMALLLLGGSGAGVWFAGLVPPSFSEKVAGLISPEEEPFDDDPVSPEEEAEEPLPEIAAVVPDPKPVVPLLEPEVSSGPEVPVENVITKAEPLVPDAPAPVTSAAPVPLETPTEETPDLLATPTTEETPTAQSAPVLAALEPDVAPEVSSEPALNRLSQQLSWLRKYQPEPCTYVGLLRANSTTLFLEGFAQNVAPFTKLLDEFTEAHNVEPEIGVRLVNAPQCAILDFMNREETAPGPAPQVILLNKSDVLKSGETVRGRIEGLNGRKVVLFLVNGVGGVTNMKDWMAYSSDGTASFSFSVRLNDGADPTPQLLLALATDDPILTLSVVPNGVAARALVPFIEKEVSKTGKLTATALTYFRLESN